jgi:hypothetical protein
MSADEPQNTRQPPLRQGDRFAASDQTGRWVWMEHAACRGVGASEFFGTAAAPGRERCRRCPVIDTCFWWAIVAESDLGYRCGIWGGATPAVRAQVAWVIGVDHARSRFTASAAQWAQAPLAQRTEPQKTG